jgi:ABC-type transporter Mla MlaB component
MSKSGLNWQVARKEGNTTVVFSGDLDETVDFAELRRGLSGAVVFDLGDIRRIDSAGVREWISFMRELPAVEPLVFTRCSPSFVTQLNLIFNFHGHAKIESFLAPYVCMSCDREEEKLLDVSDFPDGHGETMPDFACTKCKQPMEFDDLPSRYTFFLG